MAEEACLKRKASTDIEDLRAHHPGTAAEGIFVQSSSEQWRQYTLKDLDEFYRRSKFGCMNDVKCYHVEYDSDCTHNCSFCYRLGYVRPIKPSKLTESVEEPEKIRDTAKALAQKNYEKRLDGKGDECPGEVHNCISTDAFQHKSIVQLTARTTTRALLENGSLVSFVSKGVPYDDDGWLSWTEIFVRFPRLIFWQTTCASMDEKIQAKLEPGAPPPSLRMQWLTSVVNAGVGHVSGRINPLIPDLNDSPAQVTAAIEAYAKIFNAAPVSVEADGTKSRNFRIAISYVYGTEVICDNIWKATKYNLWPYLEKTPVALEGGSPKFLVDKVIRRKTYNFAIDLGKKHGIDVQICGCDNKDLPEFAGHHCGISARSGWPDVPLMDAKELRKYAASR